MSIRVVGARRNKKGLIAILVVAFASIVAVGAGSIYFMKIKDNYNKKLQQYEEKIRKVEKKLQDNSRTVLVPKSDLKYNTPLKEEMFEKMEIYSSLPLQEYISEEDYGKVIKYNIKAKTPIMKYMIAEEEIPDDLREIELNMLILQMNLAKNDYVDVRIRYPNGEDYIVVSKKKLRNIDFSSTTIWICLDEKEVMTISSAVVDSYLKGGGTKLYVTKYVEPAIQKEAVATYPVNESVRNAMMNDPNILEKASIALAAQARVDLENRLLTLTPAAVSGVAAGLTEEQNKMKETASKLTKQVEELQKEEKKAAKQSDTKQDPIDAKTNSSNTNQDDNKGSEGNGFFD